MVSTITMKPDLHAPFFSWGHMILFQQNHLLRLHEVSRREPVEVYTTRGRRAVGTAAGDASSA